MNRSEPLQTLKNAIAAVKTPACVGLDPVDDRIPGEIPGDAPERAWVFCRGVLDAVKGVVGVVKPQSACFERYGSAGYAALERVVGYAREQGFVVILDAKRGDIGSSAAHYAAGAVSMGAHWITCSPYMGRSSIEPFVDAGLGVYALCRTSNADAAEVQSSELVGGGSVALRTAKMIASMGTGVGAVVGATNEPGECEALRGVMPETSWLVPGVGAQGARVEDLGPMCVGGVSSAEGLGVVINASRSVLYPEGGEGGEGAWDARVRAAAQSLACSCASLIGSHGG